MGKKIGMKIGVVKPKITGHDQMISYRLMRKLYDVQFTLGWLTWLKGRCLFSFMVGRLSVLQTEYSSRNFQNIRYWHSLEPAPCPSTSLSESQESMRLETCPIVNTYLINFGIASTNTYNSCTWPQGCNLWFWLVHSRAHISNGCLYGDSKWH